MTRYLTALETEDELRVLLSQRMRSMDAGRSVSLEAFKEKHEQLESEGRSVNPHKVILDSDLAESLGGCHRVPGARSSPFSKS